MFLSLSHSLHLGHKKTTFSSEWKGIRILIMQWIKKIVICGKKETKSIHFCHWVEGINMRMKGKANAFNQQQEFLSEKCDTFMLRHKNSILN